MNNFEKKTILITGGSQGLGLALAFALGERGARLALVARTAKPLDAAITALKLAGIEAYPIVGDVGDAPSALRIAALAHQALGDIDILIHNASTLGPLPMPALADLDTEDFLRVLQVNLLGPHRLTKAIGGNMILRGQGTIIGISSDAAESAYDGWGAYSAAKVALDHMNRVWAEETRNSGLRFLNIDPGEMNTQMHADALPEADTNLLAEPAAVANAIANILADPTVPSGARVSASLAEAQS